MKKEKKDPGKGGLCGDGAITRITPKPSNAGNQKHCELYFNIADIPQQRIGSFCAGTETEKKFGKRYDET